MVGGVRARFNNWWYLVTGTALTTPQWCLWYQHGQFTSNDGIWGDAPFRGVLGLTVETVHGWRVLLGEHYGIPSWNKLPVPLDVWGVMDLLDLPDTKPSDVSLVALDVAGIKIGRYLDDTEWVKVRTYIAQESRIVMGGDSYSKSHRNPDEPQHREVMV